MLFLLLMRDEEMRSNKWMEEMLPAPARARGCYLDPCSSVRGRRVQAHI